MFPNMFGEIHGVSEKLGTGGTYEVVVLDGDPVVLQQMHRQSVLLLHRHFALRTMVVVVPCGSDVINNFKM